MIGTKTDTAFSGWVSVVRPASYLDVVGAHLPLALSLGLVLMAAGFIPFDRIPLHPCLFLAWTGYPCPFCGFTRAFVAVAHGRIGQALYNCPLAVALFAVVLLSFLWNIVALAAGIKLVRGPRLLLSPKAGVWVFGLTASVILGNWIYRVAIGLQ